MDVIRIVSQWLPSWEVVHLLILLFMAVIVFATAAEFVRQVLEGWRYIHVPGPPAFPFIGNIPDLVPHGSQIAFRRWAREYGPLFKMWFGPKLCVVVADADMAKCVLHKVVNHFFLNPTISLMRGKFKQLDDFGLLFARDDMWKTTRTAWQPAFSSHSLDGYCGAMLPSIDQLLSRLRAHAQGQGQQGGAAPGQAGQKDEQQGGRDSAAAGPWIDIHRELGSMTLQVVGSTAYGVDFQTMDGGAGPQPSSQGQSGGLVQACMDFFHSSSASASGVYSLLAMGLPHLLWLTRPLAHLLPDSLMRMQLGSRRTIIDTSTRLIQQWREQHASQETTTTTATPKQAQPLVSAAPAPASSSVPPAAVDNGSSSGGGSSGVAPGSFLGLMLAARNKATGEKLSDLQITAQANTFILAGYETTANALAFTIFCLASHPEAERRLAEEVDALGRGREPTVGDLDKFPWAEACISEALRLYPPAHATSREASRPLVVGGLHMPAGTRFIVPIYAIHRDPEIWPRAEEFLPERFLPDSELGCRNPNGYLPFGGGPRLCIGYKFAMMEAKLCLLRLYQSFTFQLQPGQTPLRTRTGITLFPAHGVWVRPVPR